MSIEDVEQEAEWVLDPPQVGQNVYVECGDHCGDSNENQDEAELRERERRGWNECRTHKEFSAGSY